MVMNTDPGRCAHSTLGTRDIFLGGALLRPSGDLLAGCGGSNGADNHEAAGGGAIRGGGKGRGAHKPLQTRLRSRRFT